MMQRSVRLFSARSFFTCMRQTSTTNTTVSTLFKSRIWRLPAPLKVASRGKAVAAVTELSSSGRTAVGRWLLGLSGMTFGAVVLGGVTRLTESGLSMVDWHPFKELPPWSDDQWLLEFDKYKQFPEYQYHVREHGEMTLSRFKFIWYMEYAHRMWGRTIGVAFLLPAAYFLRKGYFTPQMKPRVLVYGSLIGLQGLLGWLMVRSGLKEPAAPVGWSPGEGSYVGVPRVEHFWLSAHLSSAVVLYSLFLWGGLNHLVQHPPIKSFKGIKNIKILAHSTKALAFSTIIYGAFVAGLDAGLVYNSWPKMADRWIPEDLIVPRYGSTLGNLVNNPTAVQFVHRLLAYGTTAAAVGLWTVTVRKGGAARTGPRIRAAAHLVLAAVLGQTALGVVTLVHYVPVWLGAMHQSGSLVLFSALLWFTHCLRAVAK